MSTEEVMGFQSRGKPNFENFGTPTWESRDKMTFGVSPMVKHKEYYKGKGGGFPQVQVVVNLMSPCLLVLRPCTKNALTIR